MRLVTPPGLAYPITVTRIHSAVGDSIEQNATLFTYRYIGILHNQYDEDTGEFLSLKCDAPFTVPTVALPRATDLTRYDSALTWINPCLLKDGTVLLGGSHHIR